MSIPGAFTPTEIFNAYSAGADIIKVFPGVSGPGFIKEVLAPLPFIPLMPTGGISLQNFMNLNEQEQLLLVSGNRWLIPNRKLVKLI